MTHNKKLFINLSITIFIIFIITTITTLIYEFTHLENHVKEKAITSSKIVGNQYIIRNTIGHEQNKRDFTLEIEETFENFNIHLFKIKDMHQKSIFDFTSKKYKDIESNIKNHKHSINIHTENHIKISIIHDSILDMYYIDLKMPWKINDNMGELHSFYNATKDVNDIYEGWMDKIIEVGIICLLILISIYPIILLLQKDLLIINKQLSQTNISILKILGNAIAQRDSDTNSHNYRVTLYSLLLGEKLNISNKELKDLIQGSFLHDIGKIGISDNILLKPSKLTKDEFKTMKKHVIIGADIIKECELLESSKDIILYHHEKYDGTGYFEKLKGKEIPLNARIFAITDVFDALTSTRPYKEEFSFQEAKNIMIKESGKHFDPILLETFFDIIFNFYEDVKSNNSEEYLSKLLNKKIIQYY